MKLLKNESSDLPPGPGRACVRVPACGPRANTTELRRKRVSSAGSTRRKALPACRCVGDRSSEGPLVSASAPRGMRPSAGSAGSSEGGPAPHSGEHLAGTVIGMCTHCRAHTLSKRNNAAGMKVQASNVCSSAFRSARCSPCLLGLLPSHLPKASGHSGADTAARTPKARRHRAAGHAAPECLSGTVKHSVTRAVSRRAAGMPMHTSWPPAAASKLRWPAAAVQPQLTTSAADRSVRGACLRLPSAGAWCRADLAHEQAHGSDDPEQGKAKRRLEHPSRCFF